MDFIVNGMFLWLAITVVGGAYTIFSQVSRMKRLMNGGIEFASSMHQGEDLKAFAKNTGGSLFDGIGLTIFAAFAAGISGVLFLVAVAGRLLG